MKKLFIFFMCIVTQFYCIYGESYSEIIKKIEENKEIVFSNEYDYLLDKYITEENLKRKSIIMNLKSQFQSNFMVEIPGQTIKMLSTEVTQELYESIIGKNPSHYRDNPKKGELQIKRPVESVSWYDAIYFCNLLSETMLLTPVYSLDGETDVKKWIYKPHNEYELRGKIEQNLNANGYRLPTVEEWQYAAKGGVDYIYSGSDSFDIVAWYGSNVDSLNYTHEVGKKIANGYGLYDMSGNVSEWCWDSSSDSHRFHCGGSCWHLASGCKVDGKISDNAKYRYKNLGFRIVCSQE